MVKHNGFHAIDQRWNALPWLYIQYNLPLALDACIGEGAVPHQSYTFYLDEQEQKAIQKKMQALQTDKPETASSITNRTIAKSVILQ